ncbi:MAG TPA: alcohol dehydrogenase catalytic domain-containing protein [Acidimicrobiales bacterium]
MKALVVSTPGSVAVVTIDEPSVGANDVAVAPLLSGMCGTDLELIDGTIDPAFVRYPLVLGHEWVGRLLNDVDGVANAGEHVVAEGLIPCEACAECRSGNSNRCTTYDEIGFTRPGALAERIVVPKRLVHRLEDTVDVADAAFIEPMAVVWRALTRIPLRSSLRVAIVGDGTIALLCAHLVRLFDPETVVVVGRRKAQGQLAEAAGANEFLTVAPNASFDLIIEAAGNASSVLSALSLAARGAMVILLGLPVHGTKIEVAPDDFVNNDLILQGSFSYTREAFARVVAEVNAGRLKPSFLITHRFSLDESTHAIDALRGRVPDSVARGKVVVTVS